MKRSGRSQLTLMGLLTACACMSVVLLAGCTTKTRPIRLSECEGQVCSEYLQQISNPRLDSPDDLEEVDYAAAPISIENFDQVAPWDLSLDECVRLALKNSKVMQKLGGVVVNAPQGATTLYDQAIAETSPQGVEAALSQFDAQLTSVFNYNRSERVFNNPFVGGGAGALISNRSDFRFEVSKPTAYGGTLTARNLTNYDRNNSPANAFGSIYDLVNQLEFRQPLARGAGAQVNRIAGPNAITGQYNGVLIARIRSDQSLADFESAVRDLIRDVEMNYWELYNAWRNLDTQLTARDFARETWENRKLRLDSGVGRPDDEAQARQQYFTFESQAQVALAGRGQGQPGVLGAERNLRRLMGIGPSDGRVIRPATEPTVAPVALDWDASQNQAKNRRVELRRQTWSVRQRELELVAAKQLNKWNFDLVGNYGWRGFGDNLFGSRDRINGSAVEDLTSGDLDDWSLGFELNGPLGRRSGHLAIRNAELNLVRERTILAEQQRQIVHDLNGVFTEVDRSFVGMRSSFNARIASQDELEPKRKRVEEGQDQVFFLLDAQQRLATAESALHRSIADYNLAILDYYFTTGGLLNRFNIHLTEGPWSDAAVQKASIKAGRLQPAEGCCPDVAPVSGGPFEQRAATIPSFLSRGQEVPVQQVVIEEENPDDASDGAVTQGDVIEEKPMSGNSGSSSKNLEPAIESPEIESPEMESNRRKLSPEELEELNRIDEALLETERIPDRSASRVRTLLRAVTR